MAVAAAGESSFDFSTSKIHLCCLVAEEFPIHTRMYRFALWFIALLFTMFADLSLDVGLSGL